MSFLMSSSHLFFGLPSGRLNIGFHLYTFFTILSSGIRCKWPNQLNLLKPTGYVMHHQQFNIQQLYALPTLYLCVLYLSENKQRLVSLTA